MTKRFAELPPGKPADDLELEILQRWRDERLFERTLREREGAPSYVFYDGPPTANGKPGIHHVFSRTLKDLFCRHRSAKGFHVLRKAGWDTHGLPVEIEVEKALGINGKQGIETFGVAAFNQRCRDSVFTYKDDWQKLSERIAYWLDYDHPYITYTNEYVESVWWALATLFEKKLLTRGHKILPYCPRCGTALSSHEVAQGYEEVEDPSVYVQLEVTDAGSRASDVAGARILVWTTTPWTLVSNTALAVKPDLTYVVVQHKTKLKEKLIIAESRLSGAFGADWDTRWTIQSRITGADMVGWRYRRPFDWLPFPEGTAHEIVIGADFVTAEDGSGVVHMSPAFGADDYAAGRKHNLAFLQPVDSKGEFPADLPIAGGLFFKKADAPLIEELRRTGVLFKAGKVMHEYPHCWRCHTPLLYYARGSWFVRTTAVKDEMIARNNAVDWHPPAVGEGRFGEWLENNVDWAISRDRYWGTPLPVWVCDADAEHAVAVGGYADLAKRAGKALPKDFDPHKPFIDEYHWGCTTKGCNGTMRRVPEVIDAWFDSGSMPFAQWHFPFENADVVKRQFPADYICEGVDQTRGWFYSLLAIAAGLGDALPNNQTADRRPKTEDRSGNSAPYRHVLVNGHLRDENGKKMSKHIGNVVDPWRVMKDYGADATRFFFVVASDVGIQRNFDERVLREQAVRFFIQLKNVYSGVFATMANFGWAPSAADPKAEDRPPFDRWMLSRLSGVEQEVDAALERYDATAAARALHSFVDEDVANWYVRRNKDRLYDLSGADHRAAFATLHEVLVVTCRLLAPIAPFITDWMHRELTGDSVHVAPFVRAKRGERDLKLESAMAGTRQLANLGRAAREEAKIKVRQPLARAIAVAPSVNMDYLRALMPILADELNVEEITFAGSSDDLVTLRAKANFRSLGKRFGKSTPQAAAIVNALTSSELLAFESGKVLTITVDGASHDLLHEDVEIHKSASGEFVVQELGGFVTAIDPKITDDLRIKGMARELISRVQRMRKEAGLAVSDRIRLAITGDPDVTQAVSRHGDWIKHEVLATELLDKPDRLQDQLAAESLDLDGVSARIALSRTN